MRKRRCSRLAASGVEPLHRIGPRVHHGDGKPAPYLAPAPRLLRRGVVGAPSLGLWLQPDDCCNSSSWVATELTPSGFMFLKWGWKSFTLAHGLKEGHVCSTSSSTGPPHSS